MNLPNPFNPKRKKYIPGRRAKTEKKLPPLKKNLGQHFLTDDNMMDQIVESANISEEDFIIEIGAGSGLLTKKLIKRAKKVVSFELDQRWELELMKMEKENSNFKVIMGDFLSFDLKNFFDEQNKKENQQKNHEEDLQKNKAENINKWRVVANIPYNITAPIIEKIIMDGKDNITDSVLLVQKEVADRLCAKAGNKDYGRLTVFVQFFCEVEKLLDVPPDVFTPPPRVDSALFRMEFRPKPGITHGQTDKEINNNLKEGIDENLFFLLVKTAFSQRRKKLKNNMKGLAGIKGFTGRISSDEINKILLESDISPDCRAEDLTMDDYLKLYHWFKKYRQI